MRWPLWVRDVYHRLSSASKVEFGIDVINLLSTCYSFYFGYLFVRLRVAAEGTVVISQVQWDLFYASSLYILIHKYFVPLILKRERRWRKAHTKRHRELSTAVLRLAGCLEKSGSCRLTDIAEIENGLLSAMLSNVQEVVLDKEGIYLNVTLLMEDPANAQVIRSISRANKDRPCREYPKENILAWQAIKTGRRVYEPNFRSEPRDPKPYKSILAIPITSSGSDVPPCAAISIDSERAHDFDGREAEIELRLAPAIALLRLTLHFRTKGGEHGEHA